MQGLLYGFRFKVPNLKNQKCVKKLENFPRKSDNQPKNRARIKPDIYVTSFVLISYA